MKLISYFSILVLLASANGLATASPTVLHVTDGASINADFVLADTPVVSYTSDGLSIVAGDVNVVYPADFSYTFTLSDAAGIESVKSDELIDLSQDSGLVTVSGLLAGAYVSAYDVNGRLLASADVDSCGNASINLSSYSGVAIISTPSKTFKLIINH